MTSLAIASHGSALTIMEGAPALKRGLCPRYCRHALVQPDEARITTKRGLLERAWRTRRRPPRAASWESWSPKGRGEWSAIHKVHIALTIGADAERGVT